jgi:hypothetical protein
MGPMTQFKLKFRPTLAVYSTIQASYGVNSFVESQLPFETFYLKAGLSRELDEYN